MSSFFMLERLAELLRYELSMPPKPGIKLKTFCSYHASDYSKMAPEQKKTIENNHYRRILPQN